MKNKSGKTFTELLTEKRLMEARNMIRNTDYPISEIASMVGFSNKSHFYKKYRFFFSHNPKDDRHKK